MRFSRRITLALGATLCGLLAAGVSAQTFPERPVQVIIPYGAGGSTDIVVRTIANKVNEMDVLGQPLAVINVTGAGGPVGFFRAKEAEGDGYTVLATHIGLLVAAAVETTPFGADAFEPVAQSGSTRFFFVVSDDSPYQSFDDFRAAAQAAPSELPEANSIGGAIHLASIGLSSAADYQPRIVQVGGGAERIKSILGGITNHTLFSTAEYASFKDSGVRALAYLGPERHPDFPDVPSSAELGYGDGISVDTWWFAPAGTPPEAIDAISGAIEAAMGTLELQDELTAKGVEPNFLAGMNLQQRIDQRADVAMQSSAALKGE